MLHAALILSNVICPNDKDVAIVRAMLAYAYAVLTHPFRKLHRAAVEARLQRLALAAYRARMINPAAYGLAPATPVLTPIPCQLVPIAVTFFVLEEPLFTWTEDDASNAAPGFEMAPRSFPLPLIETPSVPTAPTHDEAPAADPAALEIARIVADLIDAPVELPRDAITVQPSAAALVSKPRRKARKAARSETVATAANAPATPRAALWSPGDRVRVDGGVGKVNAVRGRWDVSVTFDGEDNPRHFLAWMLRGE
jgi:hypothetical protein